jgi:transketolase
MLALPGIEMSTGSLGQGLSAANVMALAARLDKKSYRVYCITGDGECHEGQIWEAAMTSSHHRLDNLTVFVDHNKYQIDGKVEEIKSLKPFAEKWEAFGWHVLSCDGHNFRSIMDALAKAGKYKGKPSVIIAETVKGKGVSFMEAKPLDYHGKAPSPEEEKEALAELCHIKEFEV